MNERTHCRRIQGADRNFVVLRSCILAPPTQVSLSSVHGVDPIGFDRAQLRCGGMREALDNRLRDQSRVGVVVLSALCT